MPPGKALDCRQRVRAVVEALGAILNAVSAHYLGGTTQFDAEVGGRGALSLLHVIDDGLQLRRIRNERRASGQLDPQNDKPRDV